MNERIRELAEQANGFFHPRWDNREGTVEFQAKNLEKFAELIVRECVEIAYEYDAPKMSGPGMVIAGRIEDRFGIEE